MLNARHLHADRITDLLLLLLLSRNVNVKRCQIAPASPPPAAAGSSAASVTASVSEANVTWHGSVLIASFELNASRAACCLRSRLRRTDDDADDTRVIARDFHQSVVATLISMIISTAVRFVSLSTTLSPSPPRIYPLHPVTSLPPRFSLSK